MISVKIEGGLQVYNALRTLGDNKAIRNAQYKGLAAGARVFSNAAKKLVPKKTGNLRRAIRIKRLKNYGNMIQYKVYVNRKIAPHAHLYEFGTGPRKRKNGGSTGIMPAHPFMAPSYNENKEPVIQKVLESTRKAVEKEANRLGGRR